MDSRLAQKHVADALGVDETSVFNWEHNRGEPAVRLIPRIIRFLGYCPYEPAPPATEWLKRIRQSIGFSQEQMAGVIGADESTWRRWEAGTRHPAGNYRRYITAYVESLGGASR